MVCICCDKITVRLAPCYWIPTSLRRISAMQEGPNRPEPKPLKLDANTTAIAVLDLSRRCENPQEVCSKLLPSLGEFLARARRASVPIVYTISAAAKGTPVGEVAASLDQRASEPILYPYAFDKFFDGELKRHLERW